MSSWLLSTNSLIKGILSLTRLGISFNEKVLLTNADIYSAFD